MEKTPATESYRQTVSDIKANVRFDGWRNFLNIQEQAESTPAVFQLAVKDSEKGSLLFTVEGGSTFMLQIVPEGGWKVHTVTFNNEDLAMDEVENGKVLVTTPAIHGNSTLNIVYESIMVDVEGVISDDASSRTTCKPVKGGVVIACEAPTVCRVYDLRGVLLREMSLTKGSTMMELPAGDTYIIDAGNKRIKVRI